VTLKNVPARTVQGMKFPGAPYGLKMACGENPKRVYGSKSQMPQTRMGNIALTRATWVKARAYKRKWDKYNRDGGAMPERDIAMDTLAGVLSGQIIIHNHCYRADEMAIMLDLAEQYGFHIRSFHHALEAYKLRDRLAKAGTATSTWADWWGFKLEAYDGIPYNASMLHEAGVRTIIHSDSSTDIRRLNQEAAKALAAGRELGIALTDEDALSWITTNPAWALGVDDKTGTITPGKMADLVVWSAPPLSVYARVERVLIDGKVAYEKRDEEMPRLSDFEVGR
jgi:imidazolonepropionase-like amidohydrolase